MNESQLIHELTLLCLTAREKCYPGSIYKDYVEYSKLISAQYDELNPSLDSDSLVDDAIKAWSND